MGDARPPKQDVLLITTQWPAPTDLIDDIQKKHPYLKIIYHQTEGFKINNYVIPEEHYEDITILATSSALPTNIEECKNLKFIHFFSAGTDGARNTPIYKDTDIPLTTSSGIHGPQIAEWVIMQILASSHKEKLLLKWQNERKWGSHTAIGTLRDLVSQRFGVLGYGSIGRQAARICKAMGMDIIAYTASPKDTPEKRKDHGYIVPGTGDPDGTIPSEWYSGTDKASLHNFLSQDIDILLVAVPLTASTEYLLGAEEFAILGKKNAHVINIARGKVLVQDELTKALKKSEAEGGLRAASLDVTDPEPLPSDNELWGLDNVAITPHVSGLSTEYVARSLQILERNITHLEKGEPLINVVDRKRGY
ncbi:D-isomer-specific 2-hydroxyacid dehydrogenase-like protein [Xylogone sp. PMI_703]|nr:D-isomer-specific 2-hydroxyacid dehydrogenase-like protein [Xylogone sp. PMI_703]